MKKLLLSLLLFFLSIISFSSAGFSAHRLVGFNTSTSDSTPFTISDFCFMFTNNVNSTTQIVVTINGTTYMDKDIWSANGYNINYIFCYSGTGTVVLSDGNDNSNYNVKFWTGFEVFGGNCDVMTSQQCQSNYDLISISDVDQEYCLGNSLCPENENLTGDCEDLSGDVQWSALYINDIQHLGKPLININIPDYIFWDYSTDDEEFNLYVGSGYDQEYIDNVISINSYRPDSQDFTDVFVGGFSLVMPYIVIVLFIIFVRKLIKRIFK